MTRRADAGGAVASFDSATAMLRALSRHLRGQDMANLGQAPAAAAAVRASALLPERARRAVYAVAGAAEGVTAEALGDLDLDEVSSWVTGHYPPRSYPVVFIGSSNGALVHLAAALEGVWLPQTLLIPVRRWRSDPRDPLAALRFGERTAAPLLRRNPDVVLHHMHDENQDELMLRHMAYFRVKRTRLGPAYEQWLDRSLAPGGSVVVVDDVSTWPTTRVGDRHVFQHGAQGGLPPEGYRGTTRDECSPEAEWGLEPALLDDVRRWAAGRDTDVWHLRLSCPEALSAPVADLHRELAAGRGTTDRLLVESFVLLDPHHVARTGAVPFWTLFPVRASWQRVCDYLDRRPCFDVVDGLVFQHGTRSAGLASGAEWSSLTRRGRLPGGLLGTAPERFPVDFASFARYGRALRALPAAEHPAHTLTLGDTIRATEGSGVSWRRLA